LLPSSTASSRGIVTLLLAAVAAWNANRQAEMTGDFESAFLGAQNVERVNALIYAVVMESRGIYMSPDIPTARKFGVGLMKLNDQATREDAANLKGVASDLGATANRIRDQITAFFDRLRAA
jgi:hypothetical protein